MQRAKDADHLTIYSDAMYPVGPDNSGEITYVHVPSLSPLTIIIILSASLAVGAFIYCYVYPLVQKYRGGRIGDDLVKQPILASARSLFGLRPQMSPTTPQYLSRYAVLGRRPDMRIARPQPALSRSRGSWLSPSSSPSFPSPPPAPTEKPTIVYSPDSGLSGVEIIVAPVDVRILGQTVESRTSPEKARRPLWP
ncbi:hypothetical protein F5148DRAFT_813399 [Russula earlei]|uniref:Uncharacterized protein n=1 Tax=Russula earlei TaxID=71964 RepID=A0ACC0UBM3_9AGAM|nr:hypothetical protein F5148DRAFT_813399 [Russula earlei]